MDYKERYEWTQRELEQTRDQMRQQQDEYYEELRARREALIQEWHDEQFYAEDWPEAFQKGLPRIKQERRESKNVDREMREENPEHKLFSTFWDQHLREVQLSQGYYEQEMASIQPVIAKLEARVAKLQEMALKRVAKRLREAGADEDLAEAFETNNPEFLTDW